MDLIKCLILYFFLQSFNFKRLLHIVTGVYCSNCLGCFQNCWLFGFYPQFVKFRLLHLHGRLPIAPCSNKMFFARSAKMCIRIVQLQDTKAHLIRGDMLSFGMDFRSKKHINGYLIFAKAFWIFHMSIVSLFMSLCCSVCNSLKIPRCLNHPFSWFIRSVTLPF